MSHQVLAGGNAGRNLESNLSFVCDHAIDSPGVGGGVVAIVEDLEPPETCHGRLSGTGDLGAVGRLLGLRMAAVRGSTHR